MKCKKLTIETDGTTANTKIFVDGERVELVQSFEFKASVDETYVTTQMIQAVLNGKMKPRKIQDPKTLKFVEKQVPETKSILIEWDR